VAHDHHHGHDHGVSPDTDLRLLAVALAINAGFMVVEVVVGAVANSLALLSDAAHMLTDAGAIALALVAARLAQRSAKGAMTYGFKRAEILSAQVNGLTLIILAAFIVYAGIRRLVSPPDVDAWLVLWIALAGIVVNAAAALVLVRANRQSLNVRGAVQHNLIDAYASAGTAIAAIVILATGFDRADPIAALVVAALMAHAAYGLLRDSGRIFMEAAPADVDVGEVGHALAGYAGVSSVHDLHVWELTSGFPALSAHVVVGAAEDCHARRDELQTLLHDRFGIDHATLQVEHEQGLLHIEPQP